MKRSKVGIIDRIGRTSLDRFEIKDGLDFLVEKAPKKFKPLLDVSALTEWYSNKRVREEKGESRIRTPTELKDYFLNVYGLIVYGSCPSDSSKCGVILELMKDKVVATGMEPLNTNSLRITQPGISPIRAIRMSILSDKEFDELVSLMQAVVISNGSNYLWQGNNRALQAAYRGRYLPAVGIRVRQNEWGGNLALTLNQENEYVNKTYGNRGIRALQTSLYQRMIEDIKG